MNDQWPCRLVVSRKGKYACICACSFFVVLVAMEIMLVSLHFMCGFQKKNQCNALASDKSY